MEQLPSAAIAAMAAKARRVPERPRAFWAVTSKDQRMRLIEGLRARWREGRHRRAEPQRMDPRA